MPKKGVDRNKADKYLLFTWNKLGIIVAVFVVSVILHNVLSFLLGIEEAVFFIIAIFLVPVYIIVSAIYTLYRSTKKKRL